MYQSMRNAAGKVFRLLKARAPSLPEDARELVQKLLDNGDRIGKLFDAFLKQRVAAVRIRCHGDLHLGRFLYTGKDFVIVGFEGESTRTLPDRRRKRSALRDVAAMSRSFHRAAMDSLFEQIDSGALGESSYAEVEPFANLWQTWSTWAYLKGYLEKAEGAPFIGKDRAELGLLLDAFRLEKALWELEYDLRRRVAHVRTPLHGIEQILALSTHVSAQSPVRSD
jgi:maltose alpha-D-glucosyltransferase/alpha-amylase